MTLALGTELRLAFEPLGLSSAWGFVIYSIPCAVTAIATPLGLRETLMPGDAGSRWTGCSRDLALSRASQHPLALMDATTDNLPDRPLVSMGLSDTVNVHRRPHFREAAGLAEARLATLLTQAGFFDGAPFSWVSVSAGLVMESQTPRLGRIDKKYGGLDISIGIDGIAYKRSTAEAVADLFVRDCLLALLRAADRHDRPRELIAAELARMTEGVEVPDAEDEAPPEGELHIRLALSDDGFGEPSELPFLHEVADAIHDALRQEDCGGVEGTEVGLGSFLIFCIEGDPSEMLRIVRPVVARYALRPGAEAVPIVGGDEQPSTPLN